MLFYALRIAFSAQIGHWYGKKARISIFTNQGNDGQEFLAVNVTIFLVSSGQSHSFEFF